MSTYPRTRAARYSIDHSFFESINTESKAYWLGFITADGNIFTNDGRSRISVTLKASDSAHLETLVAALSSDRPVLFPKNRSEAVVTFNSKPLVDQLLDLGVGPRKSLKVEPWSGPEDLLPAYWRGMVDGDGTLGINAANKAFVGLCGSWPCVEAFSLWAKKISGSTAAPRSTRPNFWAWTVAGTRAPSSVVDALYTGSTVHLARKKALADRILHMHGTQGALGHGLEGVVWDGTHAVCYAVNAG